MLEDGGEAVVGMGFEVQQIRKVQIQTRDRNENDSNLSQLGGKLLYAAHTAALADPCRRACRLFMIRQRPD